MRFVFALALVFALMVAVSVQADPPGGYRVGDRTPEGYLIVAVQGQPHAAACNCNPCNCQPCQGGCFGPFQSRPPLISVTEQVQIRGRTFGYTLQSQRPFVRVQAGGCANGQCPLP